MRKGEPSRVVDRKVALFLAESATRELLMVMRNLRQKASAGRIHNRYTGAGRASALSYRLDCGRCNFPTRPRLEFLKGLTKSRAALRDTGASQKVSIRSTTRLAGRKWFVSIYRGKHRDIPIIRVLTSIQPRRCSINATTSNILNCIVLNSFDHRVFAILHVIKLKIPTSVGTYIT